MARTDGSENDRSRDDNRDARSTGTRSRSSGVAEWFTESAVRIALALVGIILLLFAIGQMVGVDILGAIATALDSQIGQWLLVAVFALLLIIVALRGFYAQPE